MKSIKLTEQHKSKLLEMCKILFPEYDKIWFLEEEYSDTTRIVFGKSYKRNIIIHNIHINKGCIIGIPDSFHWFEFCMTYLQQVLCKKLDLPVDKWNNALIGNLYFHTKTNKSLRHPIDYLYAEFKKLK